MANKITFLNISGFTGLKFLDCSNNDITGFNFSGATNLQTFISKYNRISGDLDLKPLSGLKKVDIEGNAVKKLDFSGLSRLEDINASRNMLTGFIPSGASALINFNVSENHLRMQDLVKIKGKVPTKVLDDVEKELEKAMWNEYCIEYSPTFNSK